MRILTACLFLALLFMSGCDLTEPDERYFNNDAQEPRIETLAATSLGTAEYLVGTVEITVDTSSFEAIDYCALVVEADDGATGTLTSSQTPFGITLNTEDYTDGEYSLSYLVYEKNPRRQRLGLG